MPRIDEFAGAVVSHEQRDSGMGASVCRLCGAPLLRSFLDLGAMPLVNNYVTREEAARGDDHCYPLHARLCESCLLVQIHSDVPPEIVFADYAYFSSVSASWIAHTKRYAAEMIERFLLGPHSLVMEVASNDGCLLQHFRAAAIPVLGIEPAANVAAVAQAAGIPTEVMFFGADTSAELTASHGRADLVAANNVLAHVPDLHAFVTGCFRILQPQGVVTFEFPHILNLIEKVQFDTIYHEHISYLSLLVVERVLLECGLRVFDVDRLPTHGGSLRVFACRGDAHYTAQPGLSSVRALELQAGLHQPESYMAFASRAKAAMREFSAFVAGLRQAGRTLAAYGAAAKGNILLNSCGVQRADVICVADRCSAKQGKLLPGSHIPIVAPDVLIAVQPDDVVILPWNIADEVARELQPLRDRGTRLWIPLPHVLEYGRQSSRSLIPLHNDDMVS